MENTVTINQLKEMISESIKNALMEVDRHRPGYYAEYAKKRKEQGKPVDRHKPGYYKKYNTAHPERLEKIGITTDVHDEEIPPVTVPPFEDDGELDMRCTDFGFDYKNEW